MNPAVPLLTLRQNSDETVLMADLLHSLSRMVIAGYRPSNFLGLRLTDGRVKLIHTPGGLRQAREAAEGIRNEYGPLSVAFCVSAENQPDGLLVVVDNLGNHGPARVEQLCRRLHQRFQPQEPRWFSSEVELSKNAASKPAAARHSADPYAFQPALTILPNSVMWRCSPATIQRADNPSAATRILPGLYSENPQFSTGRWA